MLPLVTLRDASSTDLSLPRTERIYVNRNLPMSDISWIGFDMDYTLAIYQQDAMDALSVEVTLKNLVELGYPESLLNLEVDTRFPIRGLLIDKQLGNVLKMNRFDAIHKAYHGTTFIDPAEIQRLYWHTKVRPDSDRFHWIDTLFGLSEVTAYVSLIDALEKQRRKVDYAKLFDDIRTSIDMAHATGEVHDRVRQNLPEFIDRDEQLPMTLHKLRSAGKKLFLLTNSPWEYTDALMNYLLDGALRQYGEWQQYFDIVIVSARKPLWFRDGQPFVELEDGKAVGEVSRLESGRIYQGGNLSIFERLTGIRGSEVLYVGDHIYGDIVRSKKESTWRTAMIVQELDAELAGHQSAAAAIRKMVELDRERRHLEDELRFYQQRLREIARDGDMTDAREESRVKRGLDGVRRVLKQVSQEQHKLEGLIDGSFHPYWGSLFKQHGGTSSFGAQVSRYADIYMRRVSSLRHYSAERVYRSPHDFMPHEL
jgi:HAD superfamily 5'-nucleotidase-like hydrolase